MRYDETSFALFILCLATFLGFFFMFAMDAEGGPVQSTYNETDYSYPGALTRERATHTKDDYLVIAHAPDGDSLAIAYRERGGSWEYQTIHDSGNANSYKCGGVVNTKNNSIIVLASYITGTYHDVHMWIKYPADDWNTWTDLVVYAGTGRYACDIAINDTERVLVLTTYTSATYTLKYWIYDFTTLTKEVGGSNGQEMGGATTYYDTCQVIANTTGKFHFFYQSGTGHFWRDEPQTILVTQFAPANYYVSMVQILINDRFVAAGHYSYTGKPFYYYQPTHMATSWTRIWLEGVNRVYEAAAMGISISQDSTLVRLMSYCNDDERLTTWGAQWDATELTWQGSQYTTGVSDADDIACVGNFGGLWPVHDSTGIKWTRPSVGSAFLARDESGGTDEMDLITDGVDWTVDLTTADPEITTVSLLDATYGVFWEQALTKTGGTTPFEWTLLIGPAWMSLGSSNGTLYGTPDGVGSETVRAKLADAVPRYDEEEWTLTIKPASEGEGEPSGEATSFVIDEMGEMWILLMGTAVFVAVARSYKMIIWRRDQR